MPENKQNEAPEISNEQLNNVSAGGKTFNSTNEIKWDNVENAKATDVAIEELTIAIEKWERG